MQPDLILFTFFLAAANYFGQLWDVKDKKVLNFMRSLAAGLSTAYVFIILLPELLAGAGSDYSILLLPVLVGFTFFHVILKYVALLKSRNKKLWNERIHLFTLVVSNFGTSYVAIKLMQEDSRQGVVLIFILVIHTLLTDIVGTRMAEETRFERSGWRLADVISPILGGVLATTRGLPVFREIIFAFTIGTIIYISLHEEIPHDKAGRPVFFAVGVLLIVGIRFLLL